MFRHGEAVGEKITPELRAWYGMHERCYCPTHQKYKIYGARGIRVCKRWRIDFRNFLADMGRRPSPRHSIDRIRVNGHYSPKNCRWATPEEQQRNKQNNRIVKFQGRKMSLAEAAELSGLRYGLIKRRIQIGWPPKYWFLPPLQPFQKRAPQ